MSITPMTRNSSLVGSIEKNRTEHIRVAFRDFNGRLYLDLRVFAKQPVSGDCSSTNKGICIKLSDVPRLQALLDKAVRLGEIEEDGK